MAAGGLKAINEKIQMEWKIKEVEWKAEKEALKNKLEKVLGENKRWETKEQEGKLKKVSGKSHCEPLAAEWGPQFRWKWMKFKCPAKTVHVCNTSAKRFEDRVQFWGVEKCWKKIMSSTTKRVPPINKKQ
ncbi:hypothetical protein TNCV_3606611 [Trichonephila clavipes]|nr:hypothetical protein TNCV_3606611 [Trichonephila clavipes]